MEYRKREWWDGTKWTLGFPPNILDKMFMESPVHALDVVRAMGGDVAECHTFSGRAGPTGSGLTVTVTESDSDSDCDCDLL